MSSVLDFFKEHPQAQDETHKILSKVPGYEAQLLPIRAAMLQCCGAEKSKSGKVELVVIDTKRWDRLSAEQVTITSKIESISQMVAELDQIFAELEQAGFDIAEKTARGIWNAAPRTDPPYQEGEYVNANGIRVDRNGMQIKSVIDSKFLSWARRAENAMKGL